MLSRRSLLAGLGATGVGIAAAGARLLAPPDPAPGGASLTRAAGSPAPSPMAQPQAVASAASPAAAPAASAAVASSSAAATSAAAAQSAPSVPAPVASRTLPGASPTASAEASATPTATATARARTLLGRSAAASGASCIGAANGQFGSWRGQPARAASTWGRDGETYVVDPGAEYGSWAFDLDYAPQYDLERSGSPFTWQAMASGAYDDRLRSDMTRLKARWQGRNGTLTYRFQHEFNGDWYRWSVDEGSTGSMVAGWRRMAGVFRDVFGTDPRYRIAWSPNGGSAPKKFRTVLSAWPGAEYVDVIAVDYYDFFRPRSAADWNRMHTATDAGGGPMGMGAWQRFAERQGVAWSASEWGNQYGDNPLYIERMHDCFAEHAYRGSGPLAGKLVYEVYFNQVFDGSSIDGGGDFRVQVDGRDHPGRPNAARRYRELFGA